MFYFNVSLFAFEHPRSYGLFPFLRMTPYPLLAHRRLDLRFRDAQELGDADSVTLEKWSSRIPGHPGCTIHRGKFCTLFLAPPPLSAASDEARIRPL